MGANKENKRIAKPENNVLLKDIEQRSMNIHLYLKNITWKKQINMIMCFKKVIVPGSS